MIDMEFRKETINMIDDLGLTADNLVDLTKYTKKHIEKFLNYEKVPSKTQYKIWFIVQRLHKEVQ